MLLAPCYLIGHGALDQVEKTYYLPTLIDSLALIKRLGKGPGPDRRIVLRLTNLDGSTKSQLPEARTELRVSENLLALGETAWRVQDFYGLATLIRRFALSLSQGRERRASICSHFLQAVLLD